MEVRQLKPREDPSDDAPWSSPSDISDLQGFNGLIFGFAGAGKTSLGVTSVDAANASPLLIINFDQEVRSIQDLAGPNVQAWPGRKLNGKIRDWTQVSGFLSKLARGSHPFKSIMFDTLNGAYDIALRHVKATTNHRDARATFGDANDLINEMVREWAGISRERGINAIFTSHAADKQDGESGPIYIRPDITPGVIRATYQAVSTIGYLEVRPGNKRRLVMRNTPRVIGKVHQPKSGPQLDLEIDTPHLGRIIDHLRGVKVYPSVKTRSPSADS